MPLALAQSAIRLFTLDWCRDERRDQKLQTDFHWRTSIGTHPISPITAAFVVLLSYTKVKSHSSINGKMFFCKIVSFFALAANYSYLFHGN